MNQKPADAESDSGYEFFHPEAQALAALLNDYFASDSFQRDGELGRVLTDNCDSLAKLLPSVARARRVKRQGDSMIPPPFLGGRDYSAAVNAFATGGEREVDKLLNSTALSSRIKGEAYATLARKLASDDAKAACRFARKAWLADPAPFRLKWLAFRAYDAGEIWIASAILRILPKDAAFSDSEKKRAAKIREDAALLHRRHFRGAKFEDNLSETMDRPLLNALANSRRELEDSAKKLDAFREIYRIMLSEVNASLEKADALNRALLARDKIIAELRISLNEARAETELRDEKIKFLQAENEELSRVLRERASMDEKLSIILNKFEKE